MEQDRIRSTQPDGKKYLISIDCYFDFFEIHLVHHTATTAAIAKMKSHFAPWGIPDEIVTDNGPQFVSDEFSKAKCQKAKVTYDQHSKQLPKLDIGQTVYVKPMPHSKELWQKGINCQ